MHVPIPGEGSFIACVKPPSKAARKLRRYGTVHLQASPLHGLYLHRATCLESKPMNPPFAQFFSPAPALRHASIHCTFAALLFTGCCTPAAAQDISPGLWEISVQSRVAATPDFAPPPFTQNHCLTAADARDPSRLLSSIATPGATGCTFGETSYSGNSLRFSMQCTGTFSLRAQGEVSYTRDSMNGNINTTSKLGGQQVDMQNQVAAKRLGGC